MSHFGKRYRVIVEPDFPKGFIAVIPALPGLMAQGETEESALDRERQLLCSYLSRLQQEGLPLPDDNIEIVWDEQDEEAGASITTIEV